LKLLTKAILERFAAVGSQDGKGKEALVIAKFFSPWSSWTWYATEYDPERKEFFGLVVGFESELGYFSLDELENTKGPLGMRIERDLYFKETTLLELEKKECVV
jgi:hypothetical protein